MHEPEESEQPSTVGVIAITPVFPLRLQIWEGPRSPACGEAGCESWSPARGPRSRWGPEQPGGRGACCLSPTQPSVTAAASSLLRAPGPSSTCCSTFSHLSSSLPGLLGPPSCLSLSHGEVKKKKNPTRNKVKAANRQRLHTVRLHTRCSKTRKAVDTVGDQRCRGCGEGR